MKYLLIIFFSLFITIFVSAQEEKGEGDIYIENNPDTHYSTTVKGVESTTVNYSYVSTENVSSTNYVVDDLFTRLPFEDIKSMAKQENKYYFIDFTAEWCAPCKMMDRTTFRDYNVVEYAKQNYYAVQLDMTDFDAIEMQAKYNISSLPTILFFDANGNLLGRTTGLQTGTLFLQKLKEFKNYF